MKKNILSKQLFSALILNSALCSVSYGYNDENENLNSNISIPQRPVKVKIQSRQSDLASISINLDPIFGGIGNLMKELKRKFDAMHAEENTKIARELAMNKLESFKEFYYEVKEQTASICILIKYLNTPVEYKNNYFQECYNSTQSEDYKQLLLGTDEQKNNFFLQRIMENKIAIENSIIKIDDFLNQGSQVVFEPLAMPKNKAKNKTVRFADPLTKSSGDIIIDGKVMDTNYYPDDPIFEEIPESEKDLKTVYYPWNWEKFAQKTFPKKLDFFNIDDIMDQYLATQYLEYAHVCLAYVSHKETCKKRGIYKPTSMALKLKNLYNQIIFQQTQLELECLSENENKSQKIPSFF